MNFKKAVFVALSVAFISSTGTGIAIPADRKSLDSTVKPVSIAKKDKRADADAATKSKPDKGDKSEKSDKAEKSTVTKTDAKSETTESKEKLGEKVLDPSRFFGQAMIGYAAAKAAPEVIGKLFCYCGCDITDSHISLLDCFTSIHGVDCHICQEEAVLALKMSRENIPVADIQKTIDEKYASNYPFETDSPTYTKYKAGRLYGANGKIDSKAAKDVKVGESAAGPEAPGDNKKWEPKLKPGKQPTQCCSKDEKKKDK